MDWSGVDYCDVFIRLSFWRHPFTVVHPLLRHWCRDTFLQTWWRNKQLYILKGLSVKIFLAHYHLWLNNSKKHSSKHLLLCSTQEGESHRIKWTRLNDSFKKHLRRLRFEGKCAQSSQRLRLSGDQNKPRRGTNTQRKIQSNTSQRESSVLQKDREQSSSHFPLIRTDHMSNSPTAALTISWQTLSCPKPRPRSSGERKTNARLTASLVSATILIKTAEKEISRIRRRAKMWTKQWEWGKS